MSDCNFSEGVTPFSQRFGGSLRRTAATAPIGMRRRLGWRGGAKEGRATSDLPELLDCAGVQELRTPDKDLRRILGVDVLVAGLEEALAALTLAILSGKPGIWGFCNAHTANVARANPEFAAALRQMTILNDGVGVDWASRLLYGRRFPHNLNGTDLTPQLLDCLPAGTTIFLLGSPPGVAEEAAAVLESRHPISVVGTHHGFFAADEEDDIAASIRESGASLVLVGMGHPRQEIWAARHAGAINVPILCIGAMLDFSAGRVSRAPAILRRMRLEWLYRLLLEPRRMARRYLLGNATFLVAVLRQYLTNIKAER